MNNQEMAEAFRTTGVSVVVVGPGGTILVSNPAADVLFGRAADGLQDLHISKVLPFRSVGDLEAYLVTPDRNAVVRGLQGVRSDGSIVDLAVHITGWESPDGDPRHTLILRDIGAKLQDEERTTVDLQLSNNAVALARIGVFTFNPASQTVTVSDIWRDLMELGPSDTVDVQQEWGGRVHPEDFDKVMATVGACATGLQESGRCEYRLRTRDGQRWRWFQTDVSIRERDESGHVSALIGAMSDITDRKTLENDLRTSVAQFRSSFDNAPIGKAIVGLDGRWLQVNYAICSLFGYSERELLEMNFQALTHPDDLDADLGWLRRLTRGEVEFYRTEKRYIRSDGAIIWGLLNVALVTGSAGEPDHFISQIVDVTDQRSLNELKSNFVSTVSHELRTPLTSILGALSLLAFEDEEQFTDEVQRLLFIAQQNGNRLLHLVNDILDFEKFSHRKMQISLSLDRIVGLAEEALLTNLHFADKYGISFKIVCPNRRLAGFVDPRRFQQVMANLLSNAAKFAHTGTVVVIEVAAVPGAIRISVSNEGSGIPEAFQERIFTPFAQAVGSANDSKGGTGLGLNITRQIVEQMGGTIGFDSAPGGRTTFWFTIGIETPTS